MATTPKAVIQPGDDITIRYIDGVTMYDTTLSMGEIKSICNNLGFNTFILRPSYWAYFTADCVTSIIAFNIPDVFEYYTANTDLIAFNNEPLYFETIASVTQAAIIYRNAQGVWYVRQYQQFANFTQEITYNSIVYRRMQAESMTLSIPNYFYTWANIDTLYINENPLITNIWKSLPSIKGYFGQLMLPVIKEAAINNGNAVDNATAQAFETLPDQAKLSSLFSRNQRSYDIIEQDSSDPEKVKMFTIGQIANNTVSKFYIFTDKTADPDIQVGVYYNSNLSNSNIWLSILIDETNEMAKTSTIFFDGSVYHYNQDSLSDAEMRQLYQWLVGTYDKDKGKNKDTGPAQEWTPRQADKIPAPTKPPISAIDTGFTAMYYIPASDITEIRKLCQYMWSSNWIDVVKKWFNDPSDVIVGINMMPCAPPHASGKTAITAGGITTNAQGYKLTDQYDDINLGSVYIEPAGYNFLDYEPFTSIDIVLPYCGEHALDVSNVMGKTIELHYIIDYLNGACLAYLMVDGSCDYMFSGQMGSQIPISSVSYNRIISSVLAAGATIGGIMSSKKAAQVGAGLLSGSGSLVSGGAAAVGLATGVTSHPEISYTSGGGGNTGWISSQMPYIRITEPIPKKAVNQDDFLGLPAYINETLENCSGFTKVLDVHLINMSCTDTEQENIYNQLKAGVLIETGTETPTLTPVTSGNYCIQFMQMISEKNVIGKTWNIDADQDTGALAPLVIEGNLIYEQSISSPKFTVKGDIRGYNYCYIPAFNRFYYIKDKQINGADIMTIPLEVDVLQSFKDEILACECILERQRTITNKYFNDSTYWTQQNSNIVPQELTTNGFDRTGNCFILTVAGGEVE